MRNIGKLIKQQRESLDLSLGKLAALSGVSQDYIWRIEAGKQKNIGLMKLSSLAAVLKLKIDIYPSEKNEAA